MESTDFAILQRFRDGDYSGSMETSGTEPYYFKDPKKAMKTYFDREGTEADYTFEESGPGHARVYMCKIVLPVETSDMESLTVLRAYSITGLSILSISILG